jgi:NAD(P)-dependent dehydrogenase (short-subunit alcohol dehydrogenase family)
MAEELAGKVTLITGGASGIGRATAMACARAGALLLIADVDMAGAKRPRT